VTSFLVGVEDRMSVLWEKGVVSIDTLHPILAYTTPCQFRSQTFHIFQPVPSNILEKAYIYWCLEGRGGVGGVGGGVGAWRGGVVLGG
jgi:hypothetical protein